MLAPYGVSGGSQIFSLIDAILGTSALKGGFFNLQKLIGPASDYNGRYPYRRVI